MHKNEVNDPIQQDSEELRRFNLSRGRVLARLWEIANLAPEKTRNGMSQEAPKGSNFIELYKKPRTLKPESRSLNREIRRLSTSKKPKLPR